jgi:drug/metabolite transporter (DMT)-like permease
VGAVLFGMLAGVLAGVLFEAFAFVIRRGLQRGGDPGVGALFVTGIGVLTATLLAGRSIATGGVHPGSLWPFLLIGAMVPGVLGTVLVVAGGAVLVRERARAEHFRALGAVLALVCAALFAARDNVARWAAREDHPPPLVASTAALLGSFIVVLAWHSVRIGPRLVSAGVLVVAGGAIIGVVR